jgi:hypothetical protein
MKHVPTTSQNFISKIDMDTEKQKRENQNENVHVRCFDRGNHPS